jgi:hypothetical protein
VGGDDEEGSEDDDYDEEAAAADGGEGSGSEDGSDEMDDDEMGSEVDEDLDSDLEEARKTSKRKKARKGAGSDDDDDDDDNSEEETPKKKKKKKSKGDVGSPASKKPKPKKDPNAPKKPTSAYFYFCSAKREKVKGENPDASVTDVVRFFLLCPRGRSLDRSIARSHPFSSWHRPTIQAKLLGAAWKELTAEKKAKYEAMAKEDKKRYEREMKGYVPPEGTAAAGGKAKGGKAKEKKDPDAPKRPNTSYIFFSNETRPKLKEDNPEMTFGETGKRLGEMFRELSPEQKERYERMARDDKARFDRETAQYRAKSKAKHGGGGKAGGADSASESDADGVNEDPDDDEDDDLSDASD